MKKRLQVFISSTYLDLIEERQAAVSAVLKSGHIPAGMELFNAGDQSQLEIIKRWIDESDVYMLILGGRYGSVEPDSGVSYTELEYNYALETGKPLFAVVINDNALEEKVKKHGTNVLEKERPTELRLFREKVLCNMSGFFDDVKDIKLCVMESLPEIANSNTLSGWVSGSEVPDTKGLVDEIAKLNAELAELAKANADLTKKLAMNPKLTTEREFDELTVLLANIEIEMPPKMVGGKTGVKHNLFVLFESLKDFLITGVTNQTGQDSSIYFLYENICPKLQVHGLVQNEKVPSVRWRRFAVTKKGEQYLAFIEREALRNKEKSKETNS